MIQALGVKRVLTAIVMTSIVLSIAIHYAVVTMLEPTWAVYKIVSISSTFITPVLLALAGSSAAWGFVWRVVSRFDAAAYPNLSGSWTGAIEHALGTIPVTVSIRQSAFDTIVDLRGKDVVSTTLAVSVETVRGQHYLYWVYESRPTDPVRSPFTGTAILLVYCDEGGDGRGLALRGQYFTVRGSAGQIRLSHQLSGHKDTASTA